MRPLDKHTQASWLICAFFHVAVLLRAQESLATRRDSYAPEMCQPCLTARSWFIKASVRQVFSTCFRSKYKQVLRLNNSKLTAQNTLRVEARSLIRNFRKVCLCEIEIVISCPCVCYDRGRKFDLMNVRAGVESDDKPLLTQRLSQEMCIVQELVYFIPYVRVHSVVNGESCPHLQVPKTLS